MTDKGRRRRSVLAVLLFFLLAAVGVQVYAQGGIWAVEDDYTLSAAYTWTFMGYGQTRAESFGCDDLDLTWYSHDNDAYQDSKDVAGDWTGYEMTTVRITGDAQKQNAGIRYFHVGDYRGQPVDLVVTLWDYEGIYISSTGFPGGRTESSIAFSKNFVGGIGISGVVNPTFRYEFYKSDTGEPVTIKGYGTLRDLDGYSPIEGQEFRLGEGVDACYYLAGGNLINDGGVLRGTKICEPQEKGSMASVLFNSHYFQVTFGCQTIYREGGVEYECTPEGYFDFGMEFVTQTPPLEEGAAVTKSVDREWVYREEPFTYTLTAKTREGEYRSFGVEDVLPDCLEVSGEIQVWEADRDATEEFDRKIQGQKVTVAAKNPGRMGESSRIFQIQIPVKVRKDADLAPYLQKDHYRISNEATLRYTDFYGQEAAIGSNVVDVAVYPPALAIHKTAKQYEWQVGDWIIYQVEVSQTNRQARAYDVTVTDTSLPQSLTPVDEESFQAEGAEGIGYKIQGNQWEVRIPRLDHGQKVTVTFKVQATDAANGQVILNQASASAPDAPQVTDETEVWINSPSLVVEKAAQRYEWKVGEKVSYQVTLTQAGPEGTRAHEVRIRDSSIPEGLVLDPESLQMTGDGIQGICLDEEGKEKEIVSEIKQEGNGWEVKVNEMESGKSCKIAFSCLAEGDWNGKEVVNTAKASAKNAKAVEDEALIWINSPRLILEKRADKEKYKVGEAATFTLTAKQLERGCAAKEVTFQDEIATKGVKLQKDSIVVLDAEGKIIPEAKVTVKGNQFMVHTGRSLIAPGNYIRYEGEEKEQPWPNPLQAEKEQQITVEYQTIITEKRLAGKDITNIASVNSKEDIPAIAEETVPVNGPLLYVAKTSDKARYQVKETGTYTLTILQMREDMEAENIVIEDEFLQKGVRILPESLVVKVNQKEIKPVKTEAKEGKLSVETGHNLKDTDTMTVRYQAVFEGEELAGQQVKNTVVVSGDNALKRMDEREVQIVNTEEPKEEIQPPENTPVQPPEHTPVQPPAEKKTYSSTPSGESRSEKPAPKTGDSTGLLLWGMCFMASAALVLYTRGRGKD